MATKSRRSGGPISKIGKDKSAQNSLKHGLTAVTPSSEFEKNLMANFIAELTDFYQPQSPLEKLQIERIALARAKLARLYETEQARLDLEVNKLTHSPDSFFEKMPHVKGIVKGMAMELIRFRELTLPFGLTEHELIQIATEIRDFDGKALDEALLWKVAPQLAQFVDRQNTNDSSIPRLMRLEAILQSIENIIDQGERYMERVKLIYSAYQQLLIPKNDASEDEDDALEMENELEQLIREQQAALAAENTKRHPKPKVVNLPEDETKQTQKRFQRILKQCQVLVSLYFYSQEAKKIHNQFLETRSLVLKAATLPTHEAELFLRYQTTLERRLSSAIGELLELQRRR